MDSMKKKEYILQMNNNKYNLSIILDNKYINFKLTSMNDITFIYYLNKYDLNGINNKLDLNYNNLEKVMKLIDNCYNNNQLLLKYDINNGINVIMKYPIAYEEHECLITLIKKESDINEKFEILLNEIIILKNDKNIKVKENLKKIEELILDIKENINKKFEDNLNTIKELKKTIEKNKFNIENNNKIIKILKNETFNIKNSEMKNKIYEIYIKNKNIGKGFFTKINYNNNLMPILIINNNITENENRIIIKNNKENKEIELKNRMKYMSKEYNISIIEIKKEDKVKNYINSDNSIYDISAYKGKTIYILDDFISYGKIKEIKEKNFEYECYIENNATGLPIINIINNELIGLNINNKGIF
jgi:hypothetical protein